MHKKYLTLDDEARTYLTDNFFVKIKAVWKCYPKQKTGIIKKKEIKKFLVFAQDTDNRRYSFSFRNEIAQQNSYKAIIKELER